MTDLVKLIEQLVEEKTLSLDAVSAVNAVRQKAIDLEAQLTKALSMVDTCRKERDELTIKLAALTSRESSVAAREVKMAQLETEAAVSKAVQGAYVDIFNRMFANRVVRESNMVNQYVATPTGPIMMPNNSTITTEEG